jgi:cbb3-type cytochrome oxidase subunit 3
MTIFAITLLFYGSILLFVMTLLYILYLLEKQKIKEIDNEKKII